MRVLHRYLGFFLAGIMAVYAISGVILIYRDTDFLKSEQVFEEQHSQASTGRPRPKSVRRRDGPYRKIAYADRCPLI